MKKRILFLTSMFLLFGCYQIVTAEDMGHFIRQVKSPSGHIIMVAEGEHEARSVGSYSVRIYSGKSKEFPIDDFISGIILPRNGSVENVLFRDLNGDGLFEIIITLRSAGTGNYVSADALQHNTDTLTLLSSVNDLSPESDAIAALKAIVNNR